jgi:hypothetical protein
MSSSETNNVNEIGAPWYREPWFWIIISPLILVLVACAITITIAVKNADDVVIGNYYKEGLLINDEKERQRLALSLGLSGQLSFDLDLGEVVVIFDNVDSASTLPQNIQLSFAHPANKDEDFSLMLDKKSETQYFSELPKRLSDKWYWAISPSSDSGEKIIPEADWLLKGEINFEQSTVTSF